MSRVSLSSSRLEVVLIEVPCNVGAMLVKGGVIAPRFSRMVKTAAHMSVSVLLSTTQRMRVRKWSGFTEPPRTFYCIENNLTASSPLPSGEGRLDAAGDATKALNRFATSSRVSAVSLECCNFSRNGSSRSFRGRPEMTSRCFSVKITSRS